MNQLPLAGNANESGPPALRLDVVAGLTAAAVVLPKAMAYATVAGLPVAVGLYTAFVPMVIYALLGTSRVLSVSSTTTLAILAGTQLGLAVLALLMFPAALLVARWPTVSKHGVAGFAPTSLLILAVTSTDAGTPLPDTSPSATARRPSRSGITSKKSPPIR